MEVHEKDRELEKIHKKHKKSKKRDHSKGSPSL